MRTKFFTTPSQKFLQTPVSIIICARNEEKNIIKCLKSIIAQTYTEGRIQIILINDASRDATVQLAERVLQHSGVDYKIISNAKQKGKKQSISYAMQFASHELILLRDADTFTKSKLWLQSISDFYKQGNYNLIIAPIAITNNFGMLWAIQAIENNVLAIISCGSAFYNKAFLCSGANLVFTKTIFYRVNGYSSHLQHLSGDDIFFLEDVKKIPEANIAYLKSKDALVYTYPAYSLPKLISQKVRWAAKFKSNKNLLNLSLAVLSFAVNAAWLFCFLYVFIEPLHSEAALVFVLIKLAIDILLLILASRFIKNRNLTGFALPSACVYPFYACIVALASVFIKPKWKV
jgi:cellulose synthase/poly-beta-1,6-N-acetylglucosamine synthase-like glycosyltransferase